MLIADVLAERTLCRVEHDPGELRVPQIVAVKTEKRLAAGYTK